MELSLAIDTPDGIVLVVGCSHPTIEKIVEAASAVIDKPIHLVVGGTHLLPASPDEIGRIATALRDEWQVAWIAPGHCTGEPAFAILEESFGDRYVRAGLGTTIELGPKVTIRADAGQPTIHALAAEDASGDRVAPAREPRRDRAGSVATQPWLEASAQP
jgi:7,8-dihydropterin-6-yl-methyl-4-(beta-D-ribofuranosyl)aminobenzene 5'-phosphate synthase